MGEGRGRGMEDRWLRWLVRAVRRGGGGAANRQRSKDNRWARTRAEELDVGVKMGSGGGPAEAMPPRRWLEGVPGALGMCNWMNSNRRRDEYTLPSRGRLAAGTDIKFVVQDID